jgi:hypothetical protein
MLLDSINRDCPAKQGECHRKTKGFEYGNFMSHAHGGWTLLLSGCAAINSV